MTVLRSPRLRLRRLTEADLPALVALDADPEVMRYVTHGLPTPLAALRDDVLPQWLAIQADHPHLGFWAAEEAAAGAFLGWFHLKPDPDAPRTAELGYRLRRDAWGRGYATEGARRLVEHAFTTAGMDRVTAHTLVGNAASRRVMEKAGLRYAEPFVLPRHVRPTWTEAERQAVWYALVRADWEPGRGHA